MARYRNPDIDTDFESKSRSKVKAYMEERFGDKQVCSVGSLVTMKLRGAIKDMDRQFDNDFSNANLMTAIIDDKDSSMIDLYKRAAVEPRLKQYIKEQSDIFHMLPTLLNQPKTKSIHPCAMIIFPDLMDAVEWCPMRKQKGLIVSEWDGYEMDDAGFLKEDILGIKQLDKFADILDLAKKNGKEIPDIYNLPHDPEVYRYFCNGWNGDVFQLGSAGLTEYSKQLKPQSISDLIAAVAVFRPGPMENHYHEIYAKCKNEGRVPTYLWGTEDITEDTFGLLIYQEQIMKVCQELGGLTMKEADDVRRAMGKKKLDVLSAWRDRVESGFLEKGCSQEAFDNVWDVMLEFAKYSFNKCVSGDTKIKKLGQRKDTHNPTIEEMYLIKNDLEYAKSVGKMSLRSKYLRSYPSSLSLNENGRLIKNGIKDIRFEGEREVFEIVLENGAKIKTTDNHKFPTSNGEKLLRDISLKNDLIYIYDKYEIEGTVYRFSSTGINAEKGKKGFQKRDTGSTQLKKYKKSLKKTHCENCESTHNRLEVHHKDNDHGNNNFNNLITLCPSCRKKEHYKTGRTKAGEKGVLTKLIKIKSITSVGFENVYDVEMYGPHHTFTTDQGIVTCNSHSAAYAQTAYVGQYLKVHFPLEYWTVALDYANEKNTLRYLSEIAQTKSVSILPPDINKSGIEMNSDMATKNIFWGLGSIKGIGEDTAIQIINNRKEFGEYRSLANFIRRHAFKGSKVKKQTYEALISSGAFDLLYGIKNDKAERYSLIRRFRIHRKVKVSNPQRDPYTIGMLDENWWWLLKQKELTGLAFVDYGEIAEGAGIERSFATLSELSNNQTKGIFRAFGGYVIECKIGKSKRGKYARLVIEHNYKLYKIVIWSEEYERFSEELKGCEKAFMVFTGGLKFEKKWTNGNQFTLQGDSVLKILR